jgi:hypothetical protein
VKPTTLAERETWQVALSFVFFFPVVILRLYVLMCYWTWFAVPLGAPALGWMATWGVAATARMFASSGHWSVPTEKVPTSWAMDFAIMILPPPLTLATGWLVHGWMVSH